MGDPPGDQEQLSIPNQREPGPSAASARADSAGSPATEAAAGLGGFEPPDSHESGSNRLTDLRMAGKGIRKSLIWLAGIVITALVTGVVGQITSGWFSSAPNVNAAIGPTQVRLMQPFSAEGKLLSPYKAASTGHGGSCINSNESSDPDALRCFTSNQVADPCWSHGTKVACLGSPWDVNALLIIDPRVNATPRFSIGPVPWALEIQDPANSRHVLDCGFAGGTAAQIVAGLRANWDCFRNGKFNPKGFVGYALGTPQTATSRWTVFYVAANSSQAVEAKVITAWR
jgi:hypothetical protein